MSFGIERACDPSLYEPNLGINLEVSDLINQKKGNLCHSQLVRELTSSPREAAVAIVQQVNSRDQHVAILALTVLSPNSVKPLMY